MAGPCEPGDVLGVIEGDFAVIGADLGRRRDRGARPDARRRWRAGHDRRRRRDAGDLARRCAAHVEEHHPPCRRRGVRRWAGALPAPGPSSEAEEQPGDHPRLAGRDRARPSRTPSARRSIDELGLRTVGDLLRHFPRRYLKTGELTDGRPSRAGQLLTVVGEIGSSEAKSYRPAQRQGAYRVEVVIRPTARLTDDLLRAKQAHRRAGRPRGSRSATGVFTGKVSSSASSWQLTNPKMVIFGEEATHDGRARSSPAACFPIYPLTKGVESWDLQRAVTVRARPCSTTTRPACPTTSASVRLARRRHRARDWIHAPDDYAPGRGRAQAVPVRGGAGHPAGAWPGAGRGSRALGAQAAGGGQGGLLAAFDARLPFELTEGQREIGDEIEDELGRRTR